MSLTAHLCHFSQPTFNYQNWVIYNYNLYWSLMISHILSSWCAHRRWPTIILNIFKVIWTICWDGKLHPGATMCWTWPNNVVWCGAAIWQTERNIHTIFDSGPFALLCENMM